jgi:hypothetical protein
VWREDFHLQQLRSPTPPAIDADALRIMRASARRVVQVGPGARCANSFCSDTVKPAIALPASTRRRTNQCPATTARRGRSATIEACVSCARACSGAARHAGKPGRLTIAPSGNIGAENDVAESAAGQFSGASGAGSTTACTANARLCVFANGRSPRRAATAAYDSCNDNAFGFEDRSQTRFRTADRSSAPAQCIAPGGSTVGPTNKADNACSAAATGKEAGTGLCDAPPGQIEYGTIEYVAAEAAAARSQPLRAAAQEIEEASEPEGVR